MSDEDEPDIYFGRGSVPVKDLRHVDIGALRAQQEKGWNDFHPEDFCYECGIKNPRWFTPEWTLVHPKSGGITCPICFMLSAAPLIDDPMWLVTPFVRHDKEPRDVLADFLRHISDLGDDAERVASCILDAGYRIDEEARS